MGVELTEIDMSSYQPFFDRPEGGFKACEKLKLDSYQEQRMEERSRILKIGCQRIWARSPSPIRKDPDDWTSEDEIPAPQLEKKKKKKSKKSKKKKNKRKHSGNSSDSSIESFDPTNEESGWVEAEPP